MDVDFEIYKLDNLKVKKPKWNKFEYLGIKTRFKWFFFSFS